MNWRPLDKTTWKIIGIVLLMGVGHWLIDGAIQYNYLHAETQSEFIQTPTSYWECLLVTQPVRILINRLLFLLASIFVGAIFIVFLSQIKRQQQALKESEEKYRSLIQMSPDSILLENLRGDILDCNPAACEMFGYKREEMIGLKLRDRVSEDFAATLPDIIPEEMTTGNRLVESTNKRKDGSLFPTEVNSKQIGVGNQKRMIAFIRDISERKQAQIEQELNQSRLETLVTLGQMTDSSIKEIVDFTLEETVRLTQSNIGYLAFVSEDETELTIHSWSQKALEDCHVHSPQTTFQVDQAGLWAEPVRQRQAVCTNDYTDTDQPKKGFPEGHVPLTRHLGVPIFEAERIVAVAGVGNKETPYNSSDVHQMQLLLQGMWRLIERGKHVEKLKRIQEETQQLFDLVPAGVWMKDLDNHIVRCNKTAALMLRKPVHEIEGKSLKELMPDEAEKFQREDQIIINTGQPLLGMVETMSSGDAKIWTRTDKIPIRNDKDEIEGILIFILDITEARQAEAQRSRLSTAIEHAHEYVMITDEQGYIEYINPAFEEVTDYTLAEVQGRRIHFLRTIQDLSLFRSISDTLIEGKIWTGSLSIIGRNGTQIQIEASASPIRNSAKQITGYVAVMHDVTHERELEGQLLQSQKLEAIGQLAGGVAHDFNNILQVINGYSELVLESLPTDDTNRSNITEVIGAAQRASNLVRQLLLFSRRQPADPKPICINDIASSLLKMLRRLLGERIEYQFRAGAGLGDIHADPSQIEQVILNLCVNARDAMPDGGRLIIETENATFDATDVRAHPWARSGHYVCLRVHDTGSGIPTEMLEHIFEPFFTTKEAGHGTGLGLATVYGIVKNHSGFLHVDSEPGIGSTFHAYFPMLEGQLSQAISQAPKIYSEGGSETILMAEDDELVRRMNLHILSQAGYRVLVATNGEEALDIYHRHQNEIHLVFLDIVMPRKDGPTVCTEIQSQRPDIPVLFTTGYCTEALEQAFALHEKVPVLQKPCTADELLGKIRTILLEYKRAG